ncbi:hypothetical protein RHSIM_Rhsim09G0208700 [Rhododendron simsii]|uniref:Cytochrome b5 heme-binding domain-containing protein n=1 Tax=Rhododendron simsii TaxID=118357 RepID=A0A834GE94_RHOSS|nr:hypothetical protein RHSIM_Rhsim09G0208700 [Rhododendron simsii]
MEPTNAELFADRAQAILKLNNFTDLLANWESDFVLALNNGLISLLNRMGQFCPRTGKKWDPRRWKEALQKHGGEEGGILNCFSSWMHCNPGEQNMASDSKLLAFEEVNKHNKTKDCWLIISGKHSQPGGVEVLLSATGKDATNDFEDVGHSDSAREMMEKYYIGEVDQSTVPMKRNYTPPQQAPYNPDKTPDFVIKILQIVVPLLILGLAFAIRQYTKEN